MARAKGKNFNNSHKGKKKNNHKPNGNKKKKSFNKYKDNFKNDKNIKQTRDIQKKKFNEMENRRQQMTIEDELTDEEMDKELDPFQELLTTLNSRNGKTKHDNSVVTDSEEEDEDELMDEDNIPEQEHTHDDSGMDDLEEEEENEEEELEEESNDVAKENDKVNVTDSDPFVRHFSFDLDENLLKSVSSESVPADTTPLAWNCLGNMLVTIPKCDQSDLTDNTKLKSRLLIEEPEEYAKPGIVPTLIQSYDWDQLAVKSQLQNNISRANRKNLEGLLAPLTPLQTELFSIINQYQDLYYPERNIKNGEEIRLTYCLHAINHILKTRGKVLQHNAKLAKKSKDSLLNYQDQGLVRPKVLIIVPFREAAHRVVHTLIDLLMNDEKSTPVMHSKRFEDEFTGEELHFPKKNPKPEDYQQLFTGNTDDNFRIGISIVGKTLKLYADFYASDILIASPLGLRLIIGGAGEKNRDYDFLSSIELLVIDQADVIFMQNWDHFLHLMKHMHLQPKEESHLTDISRVRSWATNGWTKYYRQSLIFSSQPLAEINSVLMRHCHNYAGKVIVRNPIEPGTLCQVLVTVPQMFHRVEASSPLKAHDSRFEMLTKRILPNMNTNHILIYVPSSLDYTRIRNYLKKEDISFVQINEYAKDEKIARARDLFYHTENRFLLYSERMHFFRRLRLKGIRHIIFYQPPLYPHFYSEMVNAMQEANQNPEEDGGSESEMTVSVLFTRYDARQLAGVVGTARVKRLINATGNVHVFTSSEEVV